MSRQHKTVTVKRAGTPKAEYTMVRNEFLDDAALAPAARFALVWLLRHDAKWKTSVNRLAKALKVKWDTAEAYCLALEDAGYLDRSDPACWRVTDKRGSLKKGEQVTQKSENLESDNRGTKKTKEHQDQKTMEPSPPANGSNPVESTSGTVDSLSASCKSPALPGLCKYPDCKYHSKLIVPDTPVVVPEPSASATPEADALVEPRRLQLVKSCDLCGESPAKNSKETGGAYWCETCAPHVWSVA